MQQSTDRLTFEPIREGHADELFVAFSDARMYAYIPGGVPKSIEAMRREYNEFASGPARDSGEVWLNWAVRVSSTNMCIGKLQATVFSDGLLWVGYMFTPTTWGRGYATEAVLWMLAELSRAFPARAALAAVDTRNLASVRVLEKAGFRLLRREKAEIRGEKTEDFIYECPLSPAAAGDQPVWRADCFRILERLLGQRR